jgi:hypothetical protein
MIQQNIIFDKLLTKGFDWGPPQTLFYTVLLRNFEVAPSERRIKIDIMLSHVLLNKIKTEQKTGFWKKPTKNCHNFFSS